MKRTIVLCLLAGLLSLVLLGVLSCERKAKLMGDTAAAVISYRPIEDADSFDNAITQLIAEGRNPLLLDLRDRADFEKGHIPFFLNVSNARDGEPLASWIEPYPRTKAVVLICYSGKRSGQARENLLAAGFTDLTEFTPGYAAYATQRGELYLAETGDCDCPE